LYEVIQGRGPEAFTNLCEVLKETDNIKAHDILTSKTWYLLIYTKHEFALIDWKAKYYWYLHFYFKLNWSPLVLEFYNDLNLLLLSLSYVLHSAYTRIPSVYSLGIKDGFSIIKHSYFKKYQHFY